MLRVVLPMAIEQDPAGQHDVARMSQESGENHTRGTSKALIPAELARRSIGSAETTGMTKPVSDWIIENAPSWLRSYLPFCLSAVRVTTVDF